MSKFQIVKISNFLKSREERYKPDDTALSGLKRLDKIDFNGNIHQSEKPTKTDMIIVYPGDLVISGINVQKGAIAVYQGKEPITATIHYSSYTFDRNKIDIEYFKRFLKSPEFLKALQEQVKGGIKTEIKPKTFLPIEIKLPDLIEQQKINKYFDSFEQELRELKSELNNQEKYITQLKQAILQEAISGQLTAEWRKQNPIQKGDPNTDATALLAKIKAEKQQLINDGKLKKEKPRPEILPDEIPFSLPDSWVWCRLGGIIKENPRNGYSPKAVSYQTSIKTLKLGATTWGKFNPNEYKYIDEEIPPNSIFWLKKNDILIQRSNSIDYVGVSAIYDGEDNEFIYPDLMIKVQMMQYLYVEFSYLVLSSLMTRTYFRNLAKGAQKSMPKITQSVVLNTLFSLPPLAEQKAIVEKVDYLMKIIDQLEEQIKQRKQLAEDLMQTVLREAFV
jgi:type I restriction enzyme S subunit